MTTPLLKATARASDECGCTTPGRLARKAQSRAPASVSRGVRVSLLRVRDKIPSLVQTPPASGSDGRGTVGPGAGSPERRLLNPPCLACLILVAPTNRKLFAATLRIAAGSEADTSIDDTTVIGASDLHGRLITSSRTSSETALSRPCSCCRSFRRTTRFAVGTRAS